MRVSGALVSVQAGVAIGFKDWMRRRRSRTEVVAMRILGF